MFKNVLIAEDHESANISVQKTLADLGIAHADYVYYCDDALIRIKYGLRNELPYELLITDLSFEEDNREQAIAGGEALIAAVREIQPNIKVLVFSAENKAAYIDNLIKKENINGYVRKGRHDAQELKAAIEAIFKNKKHYPAFLRQTAQTMKAYQFTEFDITIIKQLSQGTHQKDIPAYLIQHNIKPSSLSSVEKRLNMIKEALDIAKNEQLVAICKDMGII